ncbi:DUF4338 domain-containing protein [Desulfallas sp. Bu1-1]|uniref:Druantia anti-phage system protein DruA n=1 Tax=Desulfallas sp. Bu1-1 TaxID=2787620 RepID=UPI0018A0118B|nr:DUF4338 domain-containing protein [Desulfallas sp. Bu1-1]
MLSFLAAQVASDWEELYAYRPVLMENIVEQNRFHGTCYRAANWIYVGQTQGRDKLDIHKLKNKPIKYVFLFPLEKNFRKCPYRTYVVHRNSLLSLYGRVFTFEPEMDQTAVLK